MSDAVRRVVVVGAGGHARVLVSILHQMPDVDVVGVVDRTGSTMGEAVGNTTVIAGLDDLKRLRDEGAQYAALAIGDNRERAGVFSRVMDLGFSPIEVRHPTAIVDPSVTLGPGVVICAGAIVTAQVVLGGNLIVNTGAIVDHECRIGWHAHIGPGARLAGRIEVGDGTFVGIGATVRDRVRIGAWSVIGAGAVVVEDIPSGVVAHGVPARVRRDV